MDSHSPRPLPFLRAEVRPSLGVGLAPCIWQDENILHLSPAALLEALERMTAKLPLEVRPPGASIHYDEERAGGHSPSLEEAVGHQLALCPHLQGALADAANWCALLDVRGFLNCGVGEAAGTFDVGEASFRRALAAVQDWVEPAGLFALDLADSLRIQLGRLGMGVSDAAFLLTQGREMLEEGRLDAFAQAYGWSRERILCALERLRALDPNPGGAYATNPYVVPELEFVSAGDSCRCRVMRENLPSLEIVEGVAEDILKQAQNLLSRLEGRERALARVGAFLAEHQSAYLQGRSEHPRPLGLAEISAGTGLHMSTVSRMLSFHWARSEPLGVFRLSSLLLRRIRGRKGERRFDYAYLERAIRQAQRDRLTDVELAEFLGLPRRTVAYHRLRLGLPSVTKKRKNVRSS